ncbi:MAG: hypothetical protein RBS80_10785 [Thermoguttaceae bacterium]|nr:hypothetical protein [Thermoguttaceae bacterium]
MIRVTCPGCNSRLSAKAKLAGRSSKCPKCGTVISVPAPDMTPETAADFEDVLDDAGDAHAEAPSQTKLPTLEAPERLDRQNRYLICDKSKLVATWKNDGHGWMLKTGFGMISAARNHEQLPAQGDFRLVELKIDMTDDGLRLHGLAVYQLAPRWALTKLDKGDDQIVSSIASAGWLNRDQKNVVRTFIKDQFMREVWEHADEVLDYLGNTDYHSAGVG